MPAADLIGQVYNQRKQTKGGDRKSNPQNEGLIGEMAGIVADELGVGRATVERGRLAEACERFGIAYDTAAQATRVAAAFESCRRLQDLTFGHHASVANHPQAGQLLEWAAESGATVNRGAKNRRF